MCLPLNECAVQHDRRLWMGRDPRACRHADADLARCAEVGVNVVAERARAPIFASLR